MCSMTNISNIFFGSMLMMMMMMMMMMNCFWVWLTDERRLALFPAGTIVRDPYIANLRQAASRV